MARKRPMLKVIATNMSTSPTRVSMNATVAHMISTFQSQSLINFHTNAQLLVS